jgi:cell division protein FtsN
MFKFDESAEKTNGRVAMLGFLAAVGSYLITGQIIPGIW